MHVLICDGDNMAARMCHVFSEAQTREGFPTGALYGCVASIRKLILSFEANAVIFAMDYGVPPWRFQVCPEYKQQRPDKRNEREEAAHIARKKQMPVIHRLLKPLGVVTARAEQFEGDDVISALSHRLFKHQITILSSDKDFTQLITPNKRVALYDPISEKFRDPDQDYVLKRCLDPKSSDNLDGVSGIGPAKADKLIAAWRDYASVKNNEPTYLDAFLTFCRDRANPDGSPIDKLCNAVQAQEQKVRANWRCTNLALTVADCNKAMKFRRGALDKKAFREACEEYSLAPFLEEFRPFVATFEGLQCPV